MLPTGRNFFAVDVRAVPTPSAWRIGQLAAERLVEGYWQEAGEWPRAIALSAWGTANMRTGGDDVAQALALIGATPVVGGDVGPGHGLCNHAPQRTEASAGGRYLSRVRLFRDAFPTQMDIIGSAVNAIAMLDEPLKPIRLPPTFVSGGRRSRLIGMDGEAAQRRAAYRVFGSKPGAYGAGLQALMDEGAGAIVATLADVYLDWGGFAYGSGTEGEGARDDFAERLKGVDLVAQTQDNRRARHPGFRRLLSVHGRSGGDRADPAGAGTACCPYRYVAAGSSAVATAQPRNLAGGTRPGRQSEMDRRRDAPSV